MMSGERLLELEVSDIIAKKQPKKSKHSTNFVELHCSIHWAN